MYLLVQDEYNLGVLFCPKIQPKSILASSTEIPRIILRLFKTDYHLNFTRVGCFHMNDSGTKFTHQVYSNIRQEGTMSTLSNAKLKNIIRKYMLDFINNFEFEQPQVEGRFLQVCQIEMVPPTNIFSPKRRHLQKQRKTS